MTYCQTTMEVVCELLNDCLKGNDVYLIDKIASYIGGYCPFCECYDTLHNLKFEDDIVVSACIHCCKKNKMVIMFKGLVSIHNRVKDDFSLLDVCKRTRKK